MKRQTCVLIIWAAITILVLSACGGSSTGEISTSVSSSTGETSTNRETSTIGETPTNGETSTNGDIPLFPGATPDTGMYEDIRQNAEQKEKEASPELNIEVSAYTTTASLEEVESYYKEQLAGWSLAERSEDPTSKIVFMKWTKDGQDYIVYYVPSGAIGDDTVLMIEQAWPK